MEELTKSQKARLAIRIFKTTADALALRGYYKPSGRSGETLTEGLKMLSPEIYGTMNDPRVIELKGLEYVVDRLPRGIESATRIILTAQEDMDATCFERIIPPKRRRTAYRVSEEEVCLVITRGLSEIYDILTHLTFLNNEAIKIHRKMEETSGKKSREWNELEELIQAGARPSGRDLDKALLNLSIILGRGFLETRQTYEYLEGQREKGNHNEGLFHIIWNLGQRVAKEQTSRDEMLMIIFTPSLRDMLGHHKYGRKWAVDIKKKLQKQNLSLRPVHIISANLHSVLNLVYGYGAVLGKNKGAAIPPDLADFIQSLKQEGQTVRDFAARRGFFEIPDASGTHIDCQVIDTAALGDMALHPAVRVPDNWPPKNPPVIFVMDYAFGTQAFEVMDELLSPHFGGESQLQLDVRSISVMGKAGTLPGKKGDIMLAQAHVIEGTAHNYMVENDLTARDFDADCKAAGLDIHSGPIITVFGTSLQNRDLLDKFFASSWRAVGLEMEGGHYQRAINAAIIRKHISKKVKTRYAYYASDNPMVSGQTLSSGSMGAEGLVPTYLITRVIMEKILAQACLKSKKRRTSPDSPPASILLADKST